MLYGIISGAKSGASAAILPAAANLGLTGAAPVFPFRLQPNPASLLASGVAPALNISSPNKIPAAANLGVSGAIPTVIIPPRLAPASASLALTGAAPSVVQATTVFVATLATQGSFFHDESVRQLITPLLAGGATNVRVTFTAQTTLAAGHVSIGIQSTTYNTTATPVELKFGGVSGFPSTSGASITSDWTSFTFSSSDKLIVIIDGDGTHDGNEKFTTTGVASCIFYSNTSVPGGSYNQASPGGSYTPSTATCMVARIEVS
jgi:hypothetical protein